MSKAKKLGITEFPYNEFDDQGNPLYIEFKDGDWFEYRYDKFNRTVMCKTSEGLILNYRYDKHGNVVYYRNGDLWVKRKYNRKNKLVFYIDSFGDWVRYGYTGDELIKYEDCNGNWWDKSVFGGTCFFEFSDTLFID